MRTKTKIIDGKSETFVLVCGIPKLVKVYINDGKYWLNIKSQWFTLQNETILLRFVICFE